MFLVSCGIHHNKKVIDITHISLTGFCLCKHRNTEHFFPVDHCSKKSGAEMFVDLQIKTLSKQNLST